MSLVVKSNLTRCVVFFFFEEIAVAAEVAESTIKNAANDMYPYASKIIPSWYASEEDINKRLGGTIGSWDAAKLTA